MGIPKIVFRRSMEFETTIDTPMKEVTKQVFNCHSCQKSHPDALEAKKCFENCLGKSSVEHQNDEIKDPVEPVMSDKVPKSPPKIQIDEKYNLSSTNVAEKTCLNEDSSRSNSPEVLERTSSPDSGVEAMETDLDADTTIVEGNESYLDVNETKNDSFYTCRESDETITSFFAHTENTESAEQHETTDSLLDPLEETKEEDKTKSQEISSSDPLAPKSLENSPSDDSKKFKEASNDFLSTLESELESLDAQTSKEVNEKAMDASKDILSTLGAEPEAPAITDETSKKVLENASNGFLSTSDSGTEALTIETSKEVDKKPKNASSDFFGTLELEPKPATITDETSEKVDEKHKNASSDFLSTLELEPKSVTITDETSEKVDEKRRDASNDFFSAL